MIRLSLGLVAVISLGALHAAAQDSLPASLSGVSFEQRLEAQLPLDAGFRDDTGRAVRLADYCTNRPAVLVFAQYRCPMLCNQVLNGLFEGLDQVPLEPGKDYEVIVVSFDRRETPELAAEKKSTYRDTFDRDGAAAGWHFLTGEQPAIDAVTEAAGFRYAYDPKLDQFAHASGIVVLTPSGKAARYFYGIRYPPRDLRLALTEASQNQVGSLADRVLLLCYDYDPATGRYTLLAMNLVRLGGVVTVLALILLFVLLWRRRRRREAGRTTDTSRRPTDRPDSNYPLSPAVREHLDDSPFLD
jgi:protein SCO1/2